MRVSQDMTYLDLGLAQPEGASSVVGEKLFNSWWCNDRKIPDPEDVTWLNLIYKNDGTVFTFSTRREIA